MNERTGFNRSAFLAMFCPMKNAYEGKAFYNEFIGIAGGEPEISITTNNFITYVALSSSTKFATDQQRRVTLVLHGEIYGSTREDQAQFLLEQFLKDGINFAKDINGLFAILLFDEQDDTVALITDRLGSRKVFYREYKGCYWLSTSLYHYPTADLGVDMIGVASALANGAVHSNRTLFEGVRSLERACIHRLTETGLHTMQYWFYEFTKSYTDVDEKKLRSELSELLVESVRTRLYDRPRIFLSLSAGYDSSGILAILGSRLKIPNVDCLSHTFGVPVKNSDAYIAAQMAKLYGFNHQMLESHKGDLLYTIKHNAAMGEGLGIFCDELDV